MKLKVEGPLVLITEGEPLVAGSVNVHEAFFEFDSSWAGYSKMAVFLRGDIEPKAVIEENKCTIPWEALQTPGFLQIGVYGIMGDKRRPTVWTSRIKVSAGATPGEESREPTPDVYDHILQIMADTKSIAQSVRDDADNGVFDGHPGTPGEPGKSAYAFAQDGGFGGTESQFAAKLAVPFITPEMYGAKGDGATDDSAAIQAAIDAGATQSMPVYLSKKNYKISTGLFIRRNYAIFRCDGTITYDGTGAAVTLTNTLRSEVELNAIYAENGTAVRLDNAEGRVTFCRVTVGNIRRSKTGIHLTTSNTENLEPIYYNKISYMDIVATEIGVHVEPIGYYINENRYYGGTIGGGCYYGFKIGNSNVAYSAGQNKFLSGGLEEISDDGYGIYLENSSYNIFKNIRALENYGKYLVGFVGTSKLNHIEVPRAIVSEIDISSLGDIGNDNNVINCMDSAFDGSGATGTVIQVNGNYGVVYDTKKSNSTANTIKVSLANFPDGVIKPIDNRIYSSFQSTVNSMNGQTVTLGETYYGTASMLKGEPVVFSFGSGTGRIKLVDTDGNTIFDATDGKFDGKTVSVKWSGYWGGSGKRNLWDISIEGQYGRDGVDGEDGTSVAVSSVSESTEDGGNNVVTFSDGKTLTVKNGKNGLTPQKGVDYLTEAEKAEWVAAVIAALPVYNGEAVNA